MLWRASPLKGTGKEAPEDTVTDVADAIRESCAACAALGRRDDAQLDGLKKSFREAIAPWFSQSWFMDRAVQKPRGYPGDYEMLEAIYEKQPRSTGIGEALDRYFLQTSLARAVRGRKDWMRDFLHGFVSSRSAGLRVLDIACGPCREIRELGSVKGLRPFSLHALDLDDAALEFSETMLRQAEVEIGDLRMTRQNVLRLTSGPRNVEKFGRFDLIYSVGLYDYLTDKALTRLLHGTAQMLAPGGRYVVAFKDSDRYDCTEYQWHVDWYFFQRSEAECRRLLDQSGLRVLAMEREPSGVIMMFTTCATS